MILHAGLVAFAIGGSWRGVLIEGPSGSGKSDLALRCLAIGGRLVADDRVVVWTSGGGLWGRAPDTLAGLMEVRGSGVHRFTPLAFARIALAVACHPSPQGVERMPEEQFADHIGVRVPQRLLWPFEDSAALKLRTLLEQLGPQA